MVDQVLLEQQHLGMALAVAEAVEALVEVFLTMVVEDQVQTVEQAVADLYFCIIKI
jgi:hypothetical protein